MLAISKYAWYNAHKATGLEAESWSLTTLLHSFTLATITFLLTKGNSDLCCTVFPETFESIGNSRTESLLCGISFY